MTSLDRAKRFIAQKSRTIAVSIVPLAALTVAGVPAVAQTLNADGGCTVTGVGSAQSVSGSCAQANQSSTVGGILGVKVDTTSNASAFGFGVSGGSFGVDIATGIGSTSNFSFFSGTIPLSWDFTASATRGGSLSYQLTYTLFGNFLQGQLPEGGNTLTPIATRTESGGALSGQTVSGTDSVTFGLPVNITGYKIDLRVMDSNPFGSLSVNIPINSLDIAEPVTSATPEPETWGLLGTGIAAMLLGRFRRSRR
jgi:hypothetical protein